MAATNLEQTVRFLHAITRNAPDDTFVSLVAFVKGKPRFEFIPTKDVISEAERVSVWAAHEHADVYARMSVLARIPAGGRGKKDDSHGACVLWVDLDVERAHQTKDAAAFMLEGWRFPPSIVNDSGHGLHAFWLLDACVTDLELIADCNSWLQQQFAAYGADHVHDVTRIMRVPGTINWKKPEAPRDVNTLVFDDTRIYNIASFERATASVDDEEPPLETLDPIELPSDFPERMKRISMRLWERIYSEQTATMAGAEMKPTGTVDRSTNDWWITSAMYEHGVGRQELVAVLQHPTWFSGSKFRESHDFGYVLRTVSKVIAYRKRVRKHEIFQDGKFVPVRLAKALLEIDNYLNVEGNGLYIYTMGVFRNTGEIHARHQIIGALSEQWSARRRDEVLSFIKDTTQVGAMALQENRSPLVNLRNGMLDIETGKLYPHGAGYKSLAQLPVLYDPKAECPAIDTFMETLLSEDCVPVMWEAIGYCLMKGHPYKSMTLLYGPKDTGKSQMLNLITNFVGGENNVSIDIAQLANELYYRALLYDKITCICADISNHIQLVGTNELKKLVGDDEINGVHKYQKPFMFRNPARLWFGTNQFPSIASPDEALFGRFLIFPFRHVFVRGEGAIPEFGEKLSKNPREMAGMLNRALAGAKRLRQQGGFTKAPSMLELGKDFRREADNVLNWWMLRTVADFDSVIKKSHAYTAYRWWAQQSGHKPVSDNVFYRRTREVSDQINVSTVYKRTTDDTGRKGQMECYTGRALIATEHIEEEDTSETA